MSGEADDDVDRLAQSIADGAPIDWDEIDKLPADARLRRLFALLQMVDDVAEVHRSLGDPPTQPTPTITRRPRPSTPRPARTISASGGILSCAGRSARARSARSTTRTTRGSIIRVALKLLKPKSPAGRHSTDRILHEARKLARVRHPNVVDGARRRQPRRAHRVLDGSHRGQTLEQLVRERRLSAGEATYIGQEVCRALAAVHRPACPPRRQGAERDARLRGGRIILMDFGAGEFMASRRRRRAGHAALSRAGDFRAGDRKRSRSDIYARRRAALLSRHRAASLSRARRSPN